MLLLDRLAVGVKLDRNLVAAVVRTWPRRFSSDQECNPSSY
jgi:hypothetical protein